MENLIKRYLEAKEKYGKTWNYFDKQEEWIELTSKTDSYWSAAAESDEFFINL